MRLFWVGYATISAMLVGGTFLGMLEGQHNTLGGSLVITAVVAAFVLGVAAAIKTGA